MPTAPAKRRAITRVGAAAPGAGPQLSLVAIQQELAKARTLCVSAPAALGGPFPVLSRILAELADFEARGD